MPGFSEQFIQDGLCDWDRLTEIVQQFRPAWAPSKGDVINQEVNFSAGRVDVLATFNGRAKVLVGEVKTGYAGETELQQLTGYLDARKKLL